MSKRSFSILLILFTLLIFSFPLSAQGDTVIPTAAPVDEAPPIIDDSPPAVDPGPVDDGTTAILALCGVVVGLMQAFKAFIKPIAVKQGWPELHYARVLYGAAVLFGIATALTAGPSIDFFALIGLTGLPPILGILATGIVISFGQNFLHYALDTAKSGVGILKSWDTSIQLGGVGKLVASPGQFTSIMAVHDTAAGNLNSIATTTVSATASRSSPESVAAPPLGV